MDQVALKYFRFGFSFDFFASGLGWPYFLKCSSEYFWNQKTIYFNGNECIYVHLKIENRKNWYWRYNCRLLSHKYTNIWINFFRFGFGSGSCLNISCSDGFRVEVCRILSSRNFVFEVQFTLSRTFGSQLVQDLSLIRSRLEIKRFCIFNNVIKAKIL